jgi:2'-5' RNA ligase
MNRRQATLFLTGVPAIDDIRERFNPAQAKLIATHVTLIREDEVVDWEMLADRARNLSLPEIALRFGDPQLENGLLYLPCVGSTAEFDGLRAALLNSPTARKHSPHITLIHPRNGTCSDESVDEIAGLLDPFEHVFGEIAFIEQWNGGAWQTLETFPFLTTR